MANLPFGSCKVEILLRNGGGSQYLHDDEIRFSDPASGKHLFSVPCPSGPGTGILCSNQRVFDVTITLK